MREVDLIDVISFDHQQVLSGFQALLKASQTPFRDYSPVRSRFQFAEEFLISRDEVFGNLQLKLDQLDFELDEIQKLKNKILQNMKKLDEHIMNADDFTKYLRSITNHFRRYLKLEKKFLFDHFKQSVDADDLRKMSTLYLKNRNINLIEVTNSLLKIKSPKQLPRIDLTQDHFH